MKRINCPNCSKKVPAHTRKCTYCDAPVADILKMDRENERLYGPAHTLKLNGNRWTIKKKLTQAESNLRANGAMITSTAEGIGEGWKSGRQIGWLLFLGATAALVALADETTQGTPEFLLIGFGGLLLAWLSRKRHTATLNFHRHPTAKTGESAQRPHAPPPPMPDEGTTVGEALGTTVRPPRHFDGDAKIQLKKRTLSIEYIDQYGTASTREISTIAFVPHKNLLKAYCQLRKEDRTFRIDRITRATEKKSRQKIENLTAYLDTIHRG